jgi:hypothetical protein
LVSLVTGGYVNPPPLAAVVSGLSGDILSRGGRGRELNFGRGLSSGGLLGSRIGAARQGSQGGSSSNEIFGRGDGLLGVGTSLYKKIPGLKKVGETDCCE